MKDAQGQDGSLANSRRIPEMTNVLLNPGLRVAEAEWDKAADEVRKRGEV